TRELPAQAPQEDAASAAVELQLASPPPQVKFSRDESRDELSRQEPKRLERYAPDAMLQTGPGIPNWSYLTYQLHWSGPVDEKPPVRLTIVPPLLLPVWGLVGELAAAAAVLLALIRLT